jgi:hypothetical protein
MPLTLALLLVVFLQHEDNKKILHPPLSVEEKEGKPKNKSAERIELRKQLIEKLESFSN